MAPDPKTFTVNDYLVLFGPRETIIASCPNNIFFHNLDVSEQLSRILSQSTAVNIFAYPAVGASSSTADPGGDQNDRTPELVLAGELSDPYVAYSRTGKFKVTHHEMYSPSSETTLPTLQAWLNARMSQSLIQVVSDAQRGLVGFICNKRAVIRADASSASSTPATRTYVALFADGNFQFDLLDLYPDLEVFLRQRTTGDLVYVTLNPFKGGEFLVAFSDSTILYRLPESATELDNSFIDAGDLRVILFSDTVRHSTLTLPQNSSNFAEFLGKVVEKVNEEIAENTAEAIVEAG